MDLRTRDALLGVDTTAAGAGSVAFGPLDLATLEWLIREGHVREELRRHGAPSASEVLELLRAHPTLRAHGRAEGPGCRPPRVLLLGFECEPPEGAGAIGDELREAFASFAGDADEYVNECDWLYARWGPV